MDTGICLHCKKPFPKTRKNKVFCKRNCKTRAKNKRTGKDKTQIQRKDKKRDDNFLAKYGVRRSPNWRYKIHIKGFCESCGFVPLHICQLDVDHADGNHKNDSPENLKTLCANCHRLKTFLKKEGIYKWHQRNKK